MSFFFFYFFVFVNGSDAESSVSVHSEIAVKETAVLEVTHLMRHSCDQTATNSTPVAVKNRPIGDYRDGVWTQMRPQRIGPLLLCTVPSTEIVVIRLRSEVNIRSRIVLISCKQGSAAAAATTTAMAKLE